LSNKHIQWINTPVIFEAMTRYQEDRLAKHMKLWIEKTLELTDLVKNSF